MTKKYRKSTPEEYEAFYDRIQQDIDVEELEDDEIEALREDKPNLKVYRDRLKIKTKKVKLKSGREVKGFQVNSRVYLTTISYNGKTYYRARRIKDGRFVKIRKQYLDKLKTL